MITRKAVEMLVGLTCLFLGDARAVAQEGTWERHLTIASIANRQCRHADALEHAQAALKLAESFGPDDPRLARTLDSLAEVYQDQGHYAETEPLLKRALPIYEKAYGPEDPHVVKTLDNLVALYQAQGRDAEAKPLYQQATAIKGKAMLAIYEKALGPEHPQVATLLNNLALLYVEQGHYAEAERLFKRAQVIYEKALRPENPNVATNLTNLADLYRIQHRDAEAESLNKRAQAMYEKALAAEHANVAAATLSGLAKLYADQGRYAEAEPLFERAQVIYGKALRREYPSVATNLENYAALLKKTGRTSEATNLEARAKEIREELTEGQRAEMPRGRCSFQAEQTAREDAEAFQERYYPLDEGRTWTYRTTITHLDGTSREIKNTRKALAPRILGGQRVVPVVFSTGYTRYMSADETGICLYATQRKQDNSPTVLTPQPCGFKYPIKINASWASYTHSYGLPVRVPITLKLTVLSLEEVVTVPAGTFMECIKIDYTGETTVSERGPYVGARVTMGGSDWQCPDVGFVKSRMWYAIEQKGVRKTVTIDEQLLEFSRPSG